MLAEGDTQVRGWLPAGDTLATLDCVQKLGVNVTKHDDTTLTVKGHGLYGLQAPNESLNCVHAGTAMRLLAGVLAGQKFASTLDGSDQLRRRPMRRITDPLRQMGADLRDTDGRAPLYFEPAELQGLDYIMPVASAQVKSCLLLAGLYADRPTSVIQPGPARDHTERMLQAMRADIRFDNQRVTLQPGRPLHALDLTVPGDISSAAFLLVAGALLAAEGITLEGVGINDTRSGILDILREMGCEIPYREVHDEGGEPVADLAIQKTVLHALEIGGEIVVRMIDEFPILMVAATQADGETFVREAQELRVKETDRIAVMAAELAEFGGSIREFEDGFAVRGPQRLRGSVVDGHDDHRIAMSLVVAGLLADGETLVENARCVVDSFPGFVEDLQQLGADVHWV
jgi:3-phosphoshikimate 1-carboxyvinyltransferase